MRTKNAEKGNVMDAAQCSWVCQCREGQSLVGRCGNEHKREPCLFAQKPSASGNCEPPRIDSSRRCSAHVFQS